MAFGYSRDERVFIKAETTFRTIPTFLTGNGCRVIQVALNPDQALIDRPDKSGNRGQLQGRPGRRVADWSINASIATPAAAGGVPDIDPVLQAFFGQPPTIVASTSATYSFLDGTTKSFAIASYRSPSTLQQRIGFGCIGRSARFEYGGDVALQTFSGPMVWAYDSDEAATLADGNIGKGGLTGTTFPAEPGTITQNGDFITGFEGLVTVGGSTVVEFQNGAITMDTGAELTPAFGDGYSIVPVLGKRVVGIEINTFDGDSAALATIRNLGKSKTAVDIIMRVGVAAGGRAEWTLKRVQFQQPRIVENGERYDMQIANSPAHVASATPDELTYRFY